MPREYPRKLRINAQLQRELTEMIRDEMNDPRLALVTVTEVDVAPDMRNATIKISQLALKADPAEAVKVLNHAAGLLRHSLGKRLKLRSIPVLHFRVDHALAEGDRIHGLIRQAVMTDQRNHEDETPKK
ncbi:MAG: 30S ribosome-binding factor RbfA [Pseudomonadota bacterium]